MSADGRLDLDDLGQVIEQASSLDDVVGTHDAGPTIGERLESAGITPWARRHRAALAGVAAAAVAVGSLAWFGHDPRPPDDGLPHVAVVDSLSSPGVNNDVPGLLTSIYTIVNQRAGDTVALLGISGPGIRATSVGRAVLDSHDDARASTPVLAVIGCDDPRVLEATEDDYHLLVRRTDAYGRTVDAALPMPLGSQNRWALSVGGMCLQSLATTGLHVESVRAAVVPGRAQVILDVEVRNGLAHDLALDVLGYPGMFVRPDSSSTTVPAGATRTLHVTETVGNCESARLEGMVPGPDGQSSIGVTDRTLDVYVRALTGSPDAMSTGISLPWSAQQARPVTAAFAAACAGIPRYRLHVVASAEAPRGIVDAAVRQSGDPSTNVLRAVVDVATDADAVTVTDVMADGGQDFGAMPQLTVIDAATGRQLSPLAAPHPVRAVSGHARVTVDWMLSCSGAFSPPTARVVLMRDGRSWPLLLNVDDTGLAAGVRSVCPDVTAEMLQQSGWQSVQPPLSG